MLARLVLRRSNHVQTLTVMAKLMCPFSGRLKATGTLTGRPQDSRLSIGEYQPTSKPRVTSTETAKRIRRCSDRPLDSGGSFGQPEDLVQRRLGSQMMSRSLAITTAMALQISRC